MRAPSIVIAATACVLMLAGCHPTTPTPAPGAGSSSSPSTAASESANAPTDSATDQPPAPPASTTVLPTDCHKVVDAGKYSSTFGSTPLNDPAFGPFGPNGVETPTTPAAGASPQEILLAGITLNCQWADPASDITGLHLQIGQADAAAATAWLASLPAKGYTCQPKYDGQWCQKTGKDAQYQVDIADTQFVRDGAYISVNQANFPTNGLLAAIVTKIWG